MKQRQPMVYQVDAKGIEVGIQRGDGEVVVSVASLPAAAKIVTAAVLYIDPATNSTSIVYFGDRPAPSIRGIDVQAVTRSWVRVLASGLRLGVILDVAAVHVGKGPDDDPGRCAVSGTG